MMGYAFISYSTKNQASADAMRQLFNKHSIDTWMAPYDIPAGSKYAAVITKAIRDCSCFVLLLSNDSQASEAVDSEVELATLTFKKSIITIELEKVILNDAFTFYIHNKQIIAVHKIDEASFEINQVLNAVRAYTKSQEPFKTKTVLQGSPVECGAAALAMIFAYHGFDISLEQLITETGVSIDGCNAGNLVRTAKKMGFESHGYQKDLNGLRKTDCPCIIHWNDNHFVVLDKIKQDIAYINDPQIGRREMPIDELEVLFSGTVLTFKPISQYNNGKTETQNLNIVKRMSYYELLNVNSSREIDIEQIRSNNNINTSLSAPIGKDNTGKIVSLDIHDKGDGSNGIIVGPNNSGKSELIYTFLLGLALSYSPSEVEFRLIDFSEEIAKEIIKLPHCTKSLTNFDDTEMDEFISVLKNEAEKRTKLFEHYKLRDIYQYNCVRNASQNSMECLPHVVIVVDEIKRIKVEFPHVLREIIEIATQASILGIHLLFTTSSAHGLIDDLLNDLVDFRFCSKYQSDICEASKNENEIIPGQFLMQSQSQDCLYNVQVAFSGNVNSVADNTNNFNWFFSKKTERESVIDLIIKYEKC